MFLEGGHYSNFESALIYVIANISCLLIFIIVLSKNISSVDRHMKTRAFDRVLIAQIVYFIIDAYWALNYFNIFSINESFDRINFGIINILVFAGASIVSYYILIYISFSLGYKTFENKNKRIILLIPLLISIMICAILYFAGVGYEVKKDGTVDRVWLYMLFMSIPSSYCLYAFLKGLYEAFSKKNRVRRKEYFLIIIYPFALLASGLAQIIVIISGHELPVLCFGMTISMIFIYTSSLGNLITKDYLTGLNNRNELNRHLENLFKEKLDSSLYLMMIDVNSFKLINDKFGHVEGDNALMKVSNAFKQAIYGTDAFIARYGGDEFIIIGHNNKEEIEKRLLSSIEKYAQPESGKYIVSISIGVANYSDGDTAIELIQKADAKLYKEKKNVNILNI